MHKRLSFFLLVFFPVTLFASPVKIEKKSDFTPLIQEKIIYQHQNFNLVRKLEAKDSDFDNLYFVNTEGISAKKLGLEKYGQVEHLEDRHFAVMRLTDENASQLSGELHHQGLACGTLVRLYGNTANAVIADPQPINDIATAISQVLELAQEVKTENLQKTVQELSNFETRYHRSPTGITIAEHLTKLYQGYAQNRQDVTITTFDHGTKTPQKSLLVRIVGTQKPQEIIILGSHIDSINGFGFGDSFAIAPGADDNASGTATNLEIFRILMEKNIKLQRTLEIHGYAAEEIGLVGSQDMAAKYKQQGLNVVAMVQFDMNMYKAAGTEDKIWFVENSTNGKLNRDLQKLVEHYGNVKWDKGYLYAGSSDHASWTQNGFAAAFPFENPSAYNRKIHTENDTLNNAAAYSQAAAFAKLGLGYLGHYAGFTN